jgi:hypothetical protein
MRTRPRASSSARRSWARRQGIERAGNRFHLGREEVGLTAPLIGVLVGATPPSGTTLAAPRRGPRRGALRQRPSSNSPQENANVIDGGDDRQSHLGVPANRPVSQPSTYPLHRAGQLRHADQLRHRRAAAKRPGCGDERSRLWRRVHSRPDERIELVDVLARLEDVKSSSPTVTPMPAPNRGPNQIKTHPLGRSTLGFAQHPLTTHFANGLRDPDEHARLTIEWPMLSSSISGMAATGATFRVVSP